MALIGHVDRLDFECCAGWVMDPRDPQRKLKVSLIINGVYKHTETADLERIDLASDYASINHGFSFGISDLLVDGKNYLEIIVENREFEFPNSKITVDRRELAKFIEIGEDGWLFLQNDSNDVKGMIEGRHALGQVELSTVARMLVDRYRKARQKNIKILTYIMPDKGIVCNKHRKIPLTISDQRPAVQIKEYGRFDLLPVYYYGLDALSELRDQSDAFLKTDTHFSFIGRLITFKAMLNLLDISDNVRIHEGRPNLLSGDLGAKLEPQLTECAEISRPDYETIVLRDEVTPAIKNNTLLRKTRLYHESRANNDTIALLIGTSSLYEMREFFFARFKFVHFYWENSVDDEYLEILKPDIIICGVAERFVSARWSDCSLEIKPIFL